MNTDLWNDVNLKQPPINTYRNEGNNSEIVEIRKIIEKAVGLLDDQQIFHQEIAIMSRLHVKLKRKLRNDLGYSFVKRMQVALSRYTGTPFLKELQTFLDVIVSNGYLYLPTRQMFEYILVRLQTLAKLMRRIVACSERSAVFYYDRIARNDALWLSLVPYATISRICYFCKYILTNVYKWYDSLLPYREKLHIVGMPFVSSDYAFPNNLREWLDLDELGKSKDDEFMPVTKNSIEVKKNSQKIDMGESISREDYMHMIETMSNNNDAAIDLEPHKNRTENVNSSDTKVATADKKNVLKKHGLLNVNNKKELKRFVRLEERYRNENDKKSVTVHLSFMQWQSLCIVINRVLSKIAVDNEQKSLKLLKKVWKNRYAS